MFSQTEKKNCKMCDNYFSKIALLDMEWPTGWNDNGIKKIKLILAYLLT